MSDPLTLAWNELRELIDRDEELLKRNSVTIGAPRDISERTLRIRERVMRISCEEDQILAQIVGESRLRRFKPTDDGEGHSLLQEKANAPESPRKVLEDLLQWFVGKKEQK